jgi:hypothetical protein
MNLENLIIEEDGENFRIRCDRKQVQYIIDSLTREGVETTKLDDIDTIAEHEGPDKDMLFDLVEFYCFSTTRAEIDFAIASSIKITRPYPRKRVL